MVFRAVLFDQGNTLIEYSLQGRWTEFRQRRLEEMYPLVFRLCAGVAVSPAEFVEKVGKSIRTRGKEIESKGLSRPFTERFRQAFKEVGISADAAQLEQLVEFFYEPIRRCTRPYADTAEALQALKAQGLKLAVITNAPWDSPTPLIRGDLEQWDLTHYFDAYICSGETPWRKPNPEFMWAAAKALGVSPEDCLVVGDSLEADVVGARNAGMRVAWVNRDSETPSEGTPRPDWEIRSLSELTGIIS